MKPDKLDKELPLDQNDLQKLPRNTMAKSMRNLEELIAIYESGEGEMTLEEARLLDLHIFQETGKHLPEFEPKPAPLPPQADFVVGKSREPRGPVQTGTLHLGTKIPVNDAATLPDAVPDAIPSRKPA